MAKRRSESDAQARQVIAKAYEVESASLVAAHREARLAHGNGKCETCPVCNSPHMSLIEDRYNNWWRLSDIGTLVTIPGPLIEIHCQALGFDVTRRRNRRAALGQMMELGMSQLTPDQITPDLLIEIMRELNRMDGDIVHKIESKTDRTITFIPIPMPGGASEALNEALEGAKPQLQLPVPGVLPPVSVTDTTEPVQNKDANEP